MNDMGPCLLTDEEVAELVTPREGYHLSDENVVALGRHIAALNAQIKALADALEWARSFVIASGGKNCQETTDAALKAVGRL